MTDLDAFPTYDASGTGTATLAAPVAATLAATGRVRPERIEVMLSSDRRREHPPELRARLVSEMMAGAAVSELSRREGICASVLHRWLRRARKDVGLPVPAAAQRLLPVRVAAPAPAEPGRSAAGLEVVLGNGRVLRIPPGADPMLVAQMAAVLER